MPRGSNCRGKKKMIPLTWEAFLLLLSKYTEHLTISRPLTGTALPDPLPAQHSFFTLNLLAKESNSAPTDLLQHKRTQGPVT